MNIHPLLGFCAVVLISASPSSGQVSMSPLTTFGNGDGWLSPDEYSFLSSTAATERSIAYSEVTRQLYLPTRSTGSVRVLDASSGVEVRALDVTGISGGVFTMNAVAVASDGAIYLGNLVSPVSAANPFKIYRWIDDFSAPAIVYSSGTITAGRMGDTLDIIGGGGTTRIVAGESNSTGSGNRNGYAIITTEDGGSTFDGTRVEFTAPPGPPDAGDFRAGLTFTDADTVIGSKGSGGLQVTDYNANIGTFVRTITPTTPLERPMDFAIVNGVPLLATLQTDGNTTTPGANFSTVRIYDLTDPTSPILAAFGRTAATYYSQGASGPGTGSVAWGHITATGADLYALSANNGIQAFHLEVTAIPEPASSVLFGLAIAGFAARRRRTRNYDGLGVAALNNARRQQ